MSILTFGSELLSKNAAQLKADHTELLATIQSLEKLCGSASQDILQKSENMSTILHLVSDQITSNSLKLQSISVGVDNVQETVKLVKGFNSQITLKSELEPC